MSVFRVGVASEQAPECWWTDGRRLLVEAFSRGQKSKLPVDSDLQALGGPAPTFIIFSPFPKQSKLVRIVGAAVPAGTAVKTHRGDC